MNLFVECCQSKDKENTYHALKCDFGYRTVIVSMEKDICAEMINYTIAKLFDMKAGDKVYVKVDSEK